MRVGGSSPSLFIRVYSVAVSTGGFQSLSVSSNLARLMMPCGVMVAHGTLIPVAEVRALARQSGEMTEWFIVGLC